MSDAANDLLERFWVHHVEVDDRTPLWDSPVDQIERWPSTSKPHTDAVRDRLLILREEALALEPGAGGLAPSLRTAADSALLEAETLDTWVEFELPHPDLGLHAFLFWAVNNFPLRTPEHGRRYLAKLAGFPAAVDELRGRLELAAAERRAPLARHSRRAVAALEDHLASDVAADPVLDQAAPTELADAAAHVWRDDLAGAIATHLRPALARLRDTLRDVCVPAGRDDDRPGLVHLPGGAERYGRIVEGYTAQGWTPRKLHDTGLEQVERLAAEYRDLGAAVLGTDDLAEVFRRLREDPDLHYDGTDEVIEVATDLHARAEQVAPAWFRRTPTSPCEVRAVEHGALAFYSRPAADGSRPGVFFFNTSDPTAWGPHLAPTVFHEGIPGHHFQLALAIEDEGLHELHRELVLPAFGEGWALYAERLADEMGLYPTGIDRLGMLGSDSLRACRLVVDTGMHAFGWSRQRAIDYLFENSPLALREVAAEVDRYIGMPGQATSYMVGRLEIDRLRTDASERLGDAFDLRGFHDVVLSQGMVSLPALRTVVTAWDGDR